MIDLFVDKRSSTINPHCIIINFIEKTIILFILKIATTIRFGFFAAFTLNDVIDYKRAEIP